MPDDVSLDQLGAELEVELGGKVYTVSPIDVDGLKKIKTRIRSNWLDNLNQSKIDPRAHRGLRADLLSKPVAHEVLIEEVNSPEMWPLVLFLAFRAKHPDVTEAQVAKDIAQMTPKDFKSLQDKIEQSMATGGQEDDGSDFSQSSSSETGPSKSPD